MNPWKRWLPTQFVRRAFSIALLGCGTVLGRAAETNSSDMVLWHRQPAQQRLQAMPLGNGLIGAMVFGGLPQERIALKLALMD